MIYVCLSLCKAGFVGENKHTQIPNSVNISDFLLFKKTLHTYVEKRIHEHCLE